ncbi:MAG: NBR1-Ig-like domain-containing protein [Geobacteraceae bacterium]|nr:NBR1-Ig-like domain-containing protein [Geobacteraceae bacterium]
MPSNDLADYIRQRANVLGITLTEVAKRAHLSRQAVYKVLDQQVTEVKLVTFIKLANALRVHPLDLIWKIFNRREFPAPVAEGNKHAQDHTGFVRDVTFPDNSTVLVNQEFEKTWEIQNLGRVEWVNRTLKCMDDELYIVKRGSDELIRLSEQNLVPVVSEVPIPQTPPKGIASISVRFKAPPFPCTTISYWKMFDEHGDPCFPSMIGLWCKINVISF